MGKNLEEEEIRLLALKNPRPLRLWSNSSSFSIFFSSSLHVMCIHLTCSRENDFHVYRNVGGIGVVR
jgi:hypothetical protein